jgi:hypothetical protein
MGLMLHSFSKIVRIFTCAAIGSTSAFAVTMRDEYASVGSFVNSWGYNGSAVLIAQDWILTAAHNFTAASSGSFTLNGVTYTATQLVTHPDWNGDAGAGYDVALAHLSTSVSGVTPAALYNGSDEIGQVATFVGYGFTGTGSGGQQIGVDPEKRAFQNAIDTSFNNLEFLLGCDFDNPNDITDNWFGSATPETLEGCVSNGDSGGGVFLTVNSQTYLAGIISFVYGRDGSHNADYGDASGFGQVSAFNNWILSTIPEPSSMSLLVLAASAFFRKRRQLNRLA